MEGSVSILLGCLFASRTVSFCFSIGHVARYAPSQKTNYYVCNEKPLTMAKTDASECLNGGCLPPWRRLPPSVFHRIRLPLYIKSRSRRNCQNYVFNNTKGNVRICTQQYPQEKAMSLAIPKEQKLDFTAATGITHTSKRNTDISITINANKNMLDFYNSYPTSMYGNNLVTRWAQYANMPMPNYLSQNIYPKLRRAIAGLSQLDAVNRILNWIQTGFEYEYDDKVWGHDRAFFPEESLFYPYCDCKDRSILLTRIIRDLLGLKCILIYYPGHLTAAVELAEGQGRGDYIECNGHKYFITDATIIGYGAPVGQTMNGMDKHTAKIILLE